MTEPIGYRDFISLIRNSKGVVTDSGGIQEETTWLGVPCVTLRESTERPSTIELGTNHLVGVHTEQVKRAIKRILTKTQRGETMRPPLWDGGAAERIARAIHQFLNN